jgi:bisphosphoglycerate-independent phosphoglycerate mutase (AlkP superfamily)
VIGCTPISTPVDENEEAVGPILDGDSVVTVNFRADRITMVAKAFEYDNFSAFDRVRYRKFDMQECFNMMES